MASVGALVPEVTGLGDIERRRSDDQDDTEPREQVHLGDDCGAWRCVSGGVTKATGGGAAVEVTEQPLTTVDIDRVLGFEATTVSDWAIIQSGPGTLSVSTTASQGSRSLAVASHGYVPVQSVALTSLGSRVGSVIHYDIMLPSQLKQIRSTACVMVTAWQVAAPMAGRSLSPGSCFAVAVTKRAGVFTTNVA